ncbi:MAG: endonuclease NucS [Ignavibacteria bacterium]|nr:endonuclease NucS [Ignavibacteria bacterium]
MIHHHYIIIKGDNGEPNQFPLKPWLRLNTEYLSKGIDPDNQSSHKIRRLLVQIGWRLVKTDNEVFIIKPDEDGKYDYANKLVSEIQSEDDADTIEDEEALEITFSLEKDLQTALRKNINSLEKGLVIIDDGKERNTEAGRIDITARDAKNRVVVIELKAIDAKPEVIAQTLAYMEAVKSVDKVDVRGIIVASGFPDRVKLAARQISNLKLVKYAFQFNFNVVE